MYGRRLAQNITDYRQCKTVFGIGTQPDVQRYDLYKKLFRDIIPTIYLLLASRLHEMEHMVLFEQRESQELSQDSISESRSSNSGESRSR